MIADMAEPRQNIIQVVKDYGRQLFGFIRGRVSNTEDAEDIMQDVWYQLSSQARLDDIESISGWLYRVAKNRITDNYRKKNAASLEITAGEEEEDFVLPAYLVSNDNSAESLQQAKMFREALGDALQELPEKQRNVFIWNELEEMTLQEIADKEGENIKTIISRKRYAVQHLRKRLDVFYNEFLNV